MVYLGVLIVLIAMAGVGWKLTARTSYESAEFKLLESDGAFEIRDYPDLMLATTKMKSQGGDGSFGRLFGYISGKNENDVKIAMTTPVFMESESTSAEGRMGFVVPESIASKQIPNPTDSSVQIQKRDGGRFAVIRFSGRMNDESLARNSEKLRKWIDDKGWVPCESYEFAGYDPPWTPSVLRRNEIILRLK